MKVLMLSWEFPPRVIGGISAHVFHLSRALVRRGLGVHVVTCDFPGAPAKDVIDGVQVSRVNTGPISQTQFLLWMYHMNSRLIEEATPILEGGSFDLIHGHEWTVARATLE